MLERANYAFKEGGGPAGRLVGAKICSGPIVGKKVAKSRAVCWCGLGRKVAHQSVQLVRCSSTSSSSSSSSRQWCAASRQRAGCNKYAPQKTAGLPATELQKVPTHIRNLIYKIYLFLLCHCQPNLSFRKSFFKHFKHNGGSVEFFLFVCSCPWTGPLYITLPRKSCSEIFQNVTNGISPLAAFACPPSPPSHPCRTFWHLSPIGNCC